MSRFEVGDRVRVIKEPVDRGPRLGLIGTIIAAPLNMEGQFCVDWGPGFYGHTANDLVATATAYWMSADELALASEPQALTAPSVNSGVKHDAGKAPLWWVPRESMEAIAAVMEFGAAKYSAHNWRKGMKWTRLASASLRHLTAWCNGENTDVETGKSHLWHAACCISFLIVYEMRGIGEDDRGFPKEPSSG